MFYRNLLNQNMSLGGSFTAKDTTKIDLPNMENDIRESQGKDERAPQEMSDSRKKEKHRDRNKSKYLRDQGLEENPRHTRVPSQHVRIHDHKNHKRNDNENDKVQHSADLLNQKQRRCSDREHEKLGIHRHSSGFKPHQSGHDDKKNKADKHIYYREYSQDDMRALDKNKKKSEKVAKEIKETLREESLSKFAKRSTGETVSSAKERYLARKKARNSAKNATAYDDSDE